MVRNKQSSAWKPTSPPSSLSGVWWFLIAELQPWRRWFSGNLSTFVSNRLIMVKCQVSICSLLAHCRQQLFKVINSLVKCPMTEDKEGATIRVIGGIRNQCKWFQRGFWVWTSSSSIIIISSQIYIFNVHLYFCTKTIWTFYAHSLGVNDATSKHQAATRPIPTQLYSAA